MNNTAVKGDLMPSQKPIHNFAFSKVEFEDRLFKRISDNLMLTSKDGGNWITEITCINCKDKEGYAKKSDPRRIYCNRKNKCVVSEPYTKYFPDLYKEICNELKSNHTGNNTIDQEVYARVDRQINAFSSLGGLYGTRDVGGHTFKTLRFKLTDGQTYNERLIGCDSRKTHNTGATSQLMWIPPSVNLSGDVWIAECPLDAMSLLSSGTGISAVSVLSASCKPQFKIWFNDNIKNIKRLVIAFDHDEAGIKAIKVWVDYCKSNGINYAVALPPLDKDWNDCLKEGLFQNSSFIKECFKTGSFNIAKNPLEAAMSFHDGNDIAPRIFEWNGCLYRTKYKKEKDSITKEEKITLQKVDEILDGALKSIYATEIKDNINDETINEINILATPKSKESTQIRINAEEWTVNVKFAQRMANTQCMTWKGSLEDIHFIKQNILNSAKINTVRKANKIGLDRKSEAFVFGKIAVDKDGKVHKINKYGYFDELSLSPFEYKDSGSYSNNIGDFESYDVNKIIQLFRRSWGNKGLAALGYYVSSMFSHIIFDRYNFFPFLSLFGEAGVGKSTLTRALNIAMCFKNEEGVSQSESNTLKGIVRNMSQRCSLPIAFLEGNKGDDFAFDENLLKSLYNRQNANHTAMKTMDNKTRSVEIDCSFVFVQNHELFTSGPVKERVISIKFEKDHEYTEDSKNSADEIILLGNKLCNIGIEVLKNRKYFEENIISEIEKEIKNFISQGLTNNRIINNHAIVSAAFKLFARKICKGLFSEDELRVFGEDVMVFAFDKANNNQDDNELSEDFFSAFESLKDRGIIRENEHYFVVNKSIIIKITEISMLMNSEKYGFINNPKLKINLRKHHRFITDRKSFKRQGKVMKLWEFKFAD